MRRGGRDQVTTLVRAVVVLLAPGECDAAACRGGLKLPLPVAAAPIGQPRAVGLDQTAVVDPQQQQLIVPPQLKAGHVGTAPGRESVAELGRRLSEGLYGQVAGRSDDYGVGLRHRVGKIRAYRHRERRWV